MNEGDPIMDVRLHVGNLAKTTTEDELQTLFTQAGQVASVTVITDRDSGTSKGFAFVEMTTEAEAEQAITILNGFNLSDQELKVSLAKPRRDDQRR
jgi:RNA recognition motif-containing protein